MATWSWPQSQILRVVDGDTIDALVTRDLGFGGRVTFPVRLRLNRINAPSDTSDNGRKSAALVGSLLPLSTAVTIETVGAYKYGQDGTKAQELNGEWMAEVTLPDGRNLSDVLVASGAAVYWDGQGKRPSDH